MASNRHTVGSKIGKDGRTHAERHRDVKTASKTASTKSVAGSTLARGKGWAEGKPVGEPGRPDQRGK